MDNRLGAVAPLSVAGDELERLDPALVIELGGRAVVDLHLSNEAADG